MRLRTLHPWQKPANRSNTGDNRNVDPAAAVKSHRATPLSGLRMLAGARHEPQFTHPDDVTSAINEAAEFHPR